MKEGEMVELVLKIVALICILMAAFGVSFRDIHLGWLGLFIWFISETYI